MRGLRGFSTPGAVQFCHPGVPLSESRKELNALVTWQHMKFLLDLAFIVLAKFKDYKDDKLVSQSWKWRLFVAPDKRTYKFKAKNLNVS